MIQFSSLKLLYFVKELWKAHYIKASDLEDVTAEPVEAGDTVTEAIAKLQAQIDAIPPPVEPEA